MQSNRLARMTLLAAAGLLAPVAQAALTPAGSTISNTASATYTDPGGNPQTVTSNTANLKIDEILDVTVVGNDSGNVVVTTPGTNQVLSFTVTNTGNGSETYMLSTDAAVSGDQFNPANVRIYLDNGDGVFNLLSDTLLVPGSNDPVLAAGGSVRIFVVSDIPSGLANSDVGLVKLIAESKTAQATPGIEAPGTVFAGAPGTFDSVVGSTTAYATKTNGYAVSQVATTLTKSSSVLDQFGGSSPIPGATVTYTLSFVVTGAGSLSGTQITDPIPTGTTYVAGSLKLDSGTLTDDTLDSDAGRFTGSQIEVDLGSVTAPATHTVTFKVTIN